LILLTTWAGVPLGPRKPYQSGVVEARVGFGDGRDIRQLRQALRMADGDGANLAGAHVWLPRRCTAEDRLYASRKQIHCCGTAALVGYMCELGAGQ